MSSYNIFEQAIGVQVVGNIAYVVAGFGGLQIINITVPSNPVLIGTYETAGEAQGIQVVGTTAYVAYMEGLTSGGLCIINIIIPSNPTLIATFDTRGWAQDVQVVGKIAYVTTKGSVLSGGFQIVDITTPSSPTQSGIYYTTGDAWGVQIVGTVAYVVDETSGLTILNVATPSNPTQIGYYNTPGDALGVQVVGTIAYVTDGSRLNSNSGLQIINVTKKSSPSLIATYTIPGGAYRVQVVGKTAFVTGTNGLTVIDITIPSNPTLLGSYDTSGESHGVQVVGTTVYVTDMGGLKILSGLNRLKLFGSPDTLDRGNYIVTLEGTTAAGSTFSSFKLSIGSPLAPVYQNPISTQKAMVDKSFNYVMPDNVFVGMNGNELAYRATNLPQWLVFDAAKRTFSGTPTSQDTGTYADQSTIATVTAIDGKFETTGQFTVTVTGDSYLAKLIRVGLPILSVLGMVYSGYKNRSLFLDRISKGKWRNNRVSVKAGEDFMYALKTHSRDVRKIQAYVRDKGYCGKLSEKLLCGKPRHVELAVRLPVWMRHNTEVNVLYSIKKLEEMDLQGEQYIQIRMLGSGDVIKELLHIHLERDTSTLEGTFDPFTRQENIGLLLFPTTEVNSLEVDENSNNQMNLVSV